jgi:nucleoside-diphosphate-sugar epimerase
MKVLVIGSHGFIGSYVCKLLIDSGWEVIGVDNINMYKPEQYQLFLRHYEIRQKTQLYGLSVFYRVDATHGAEVTRIVRKHRPEVVINLAGTPVADVCKKNTEEAVQSIYKLNANLLEAIKEDDNLQRYVFISSSMVYGDFQCDRPDEDAPKNPKDPYGAIKLGAELLIESFQRQFGVPYVVVRPSAVYGPLDSNMRVTGIFLLNAHRGKPIRVNDVNERLDFTYVEDTAEGIYLAATHGRGLNEVFNITRGEGRTIRELAGEIKKYYPSVEIIENVAPEHMEGLVRPVRGTLNIDKARRLLGYAPKYSLEAGIEKYVREWKKIYGDSAGAVVPS